jgi:hypothetical protein
MKTLVVLALVACADREPEDTTPKFTMADLPHAGFRVFATDIVDGDTDDATTFARFTVRVEYDATALNACAVIDPVFATVEGNLLDVVTNGNGKNPCATPELEGFSKIPTSGDITIVVGDSTRAITGHFAALAGHVATLRSHTTWKFKAGDRVVVGWSHPADLDAPQPFEIAIENIAQPNKVTRLIPEHTGDELRFTIPALEPGEARMHFDGGMQSGTAELCSGGESCWFSSHHAYTRAATIE